MTEIILDAENAIMGRLSAYAAKQALLGNKISIVNSEKTIISGSKSDVVERYFGQRNRGTPFKGPFIPRMPDRFLKRALRGMLPYKSGRGKEAYANIKCYISIPDSFKDKKITVFEKAHAKNRNLLKYTTVQEVFP